MFIKCLDVRHKNIPRGSTRNDSHGGFLKKVVRGRLDFFSVTNEIQKKGRSIQYLVANYPLSFYGL